MVTTPLLKLRPIYFKDFLNAFIFYLKVFAIWTHISMRFLTAWNKSEDLVGPDSLTPYKLHRIYKLNSRLTQICIKMAPLFPLSLCAPVYM